GRAPVPRVPGRCAPQQQSRHRPLVVRAPPSLLGPEPARRPADRCGLALGCGGAVRPGGPADRRRAMDAQRRAGRRPSRPQRAARARASLTTTSRFLGMEVRIGVVHTPKELTIEVEGSADDVAKMIEAALAADDRVVWFSDSKGRRLGVPASKVAYVEIDAEGETRRVGFGRA